jgi:multiple RNA-binding domain-containing protein 1
VITADSLKVHLPKDHRSGNCKGFAYIQYSDPELAKKAVQNLDGKPFQGRLLHIIPAEAKKHTGLDEVEISKLPLKKQQQIKRKSEAASSIFNWNSLYMNVGVLIPPRLQKRA